MRERQLRRGERGAGDREASEGGGGMSVQREHSKDLMAFRCLLHAHQRYDCCHMHNMSFEFYRA
jgi:hypothetical protein